MAHVLEVAAPLSSRARAFLAKHARLTVVDLGPDDDMCRAAMSAALGYLDERALTLLRDIQRRYSGLTYRSPFRASEIVFEPVFEIDRDQRQISFGYAITDTAPDGCRYGFIRPDGTVWFGLFEAEAQVFPSLDHFLECDSLLDHAGRQNLRSTELPADATAHRQMLLDHHPNLRRLDRASGFCVEWWTDDDQLVYFDGLDARLAADGHDASSIPTVVRTWRLDEPIS
ncbi:hypothetical protein [Polymorphospora rubra]|uniref:Uncharacterized protein n=1 Tax=Polymorphospora rubra TaxID=338584 RepID=A0A810N890_9ACTN|nr:hypothetical protein [Polymorphospora rubra]BCJ68359.1 hypothetical protein Prubr_53800 [Polymorphospora rubra]